jgi:hypothetical protein
MGGVGSGGANGGPQYNPANISGTGGAGQSGTQPARYIPGLPFGQGQTTMATEQAAPLAGAMKPGPAPIVNPQAPQAAPMAPLTPLTAPTERPNEPLHLGMPFGNTPGPEILNLPLNNSVQYATAKEAIQTAASDPNASPMMKYLAQVAENKF